MFDKLSNLIISNSYFTYYIIDIIIVIIHLTRITSKPNIIIISMFIKSENCLIIRFTQICEFSPYNKRHISSKCLL